MFTKTAKDLTGQKFGRLTVLERTENYRAPNGTSGAMWLCQCDCGNVLKVRAPDLKSGHTRSCGCLHRDNKPNLTHGLSRTRLSNIWHNMKQRCLNPSNPGYSGYGGRGIILCDEWKEDFKPFYDWAMANGYDDKLSLDRIDVNGNYEPSNCRWATQKEQCNNTRINRYVLYEGKEYTMAELARHLNINYSSVKKMISEMDLPNWGGRNPQQ